MEERCYNGHTHLNVPYFCLPAGNKTWQPVNNIEESKQSFLCLSVALSSFYIVYIYIFTFYFEVVSDL